MKKLFSEFKQFISKGNVIDLAVGVIVGGAFTTIVNSLVNDILMPLLGLIIGGFDFSDLKISLESPIEGVAGATISYGLFIQNIVNFLLMALCVFLLVKAINKFRFKKEEEAKEEPAAEPEPDQNIVLLSEIRDLLKESKEK